MLYLISIIKHLILIIVWLYKAGEFCSSGPRPAPTLVIVDCVSWSQTWIIYREIKLWQLILFWRKIPKCHNFRVGSEPGLVGEQLRVRVVPSAVCRCSGGDNWITRISDMMEMITWSSDEDNIISIVIHLTSNGGWRSVLTKMYWDGDTWHVSTLTSDTWVRAKGSHLNSIVVCY